MGLRAIRDDLERWWRELELLPAGVLVAGCALLLVYEYQGSTGFFHRHLHDLFPGSVYRPLYSYLYWYGAAFVLLGAIPMLLLVVGGYSLRQFGLGVGRWREGLALTGLFLAVMLPVVWIAAMFPAFQDKYPLCAVANRSWTHLVIYELAYFAYFFGWEFFFRGFLLFGLERRLGAYAVLVQMLPFALLHVGKPEAEAFGSILAGIALGLLALRTRSVWYCALLHGLIAWSMDAASLTLGGRWP